jgi:hypothetical protein
MVLPMQESEKQQEPQDEAPVQLTGQDAKSASKRELSTLASLVVEAFEKKESPNHERKIQVNPVVSKFATWYEKLRNAMEYREDEVILRAAIERILRRMLLLGGNAKTTAEPLVRELIWARYLDDNEVPESTIDRVEETIDKYLKFRFAVLKHHKIKESVMNEWTYQLMSADLEHQLNPNVPKETLSNFMYQILKEHVKIIDDSEETKNAQVYIAVRRAFSRDDVAFLRYNLFTQFFGRLTTHNIEEVAKHFLEGFREITYELSYPRKEKIHSFVKRRAGAFFILEDIFRAQKENTRELVTNEQELQQAVLAACHARYASIRSKVTRAIVRSVMFILLTKVIFAFAVEGTYERIVYGEILWPSIILNTTMPPLLMVIVSLFIRTPGEDNSKLILSYINEILFSNNPRIGSTLMVRKAPDRSNSGMKAVFGLMWFGAFLLSFGSIVYVLTRLHFNPMSQFIFIFFLAIVSFLSYRIALMADMYKVGDKQGLVTPLVDFLFMPVVRVGRHLTQNISRVNFLLFIFDFIIETPFKMIFAFFEQWFRFLREKSEELE